MKLNALLKPSLAAVAVLALPALASAGVVITFDDLPALPAVTTFASVTQASGGSGVISGVTFDSSLYVVGDAYVEGFQNNGGTQPFAHPSSGSYAIFNGSGADGINLVTTQVLTSAWFGNPNFGGGIGGASQVTVQALHNATVLGSVSMNLASTTLQQLDTSSFSSLSGITGYKINRVATGTGPYNGAHWIADDFAFVSPVPEPESVALAAAAGLAAFAVVRRCRRGGVAGLPSVA
ncbi:MAG TPA: hypothetical protein VMB21_03025 [Candidatus Limnocylindria bacterium]|jgi:hypothetical protein|nr:hypothetical protein [Candidatus Limnocylindria bacterium]